MESKGSHPSRHLEIGFVYVLPGIRGEARVFRVRLKTGSLEKSYRPDLPRMRLWECFPKNFKKFNVESFLSNPRKLRP